MNCPVCSSEQLEPLHSFSAHEAAQHFVLREANPSRHDQLAAHIRTLWHRDECTIRGCTECGFGFADPFVAGDAEFYALAFERAGYPAERWEFARTIQALDTIGFHGRRVLEVGAGFGFFLDKIAGRYVPASGITALEFGAPAIEEMLRKGYAALGDDIREADLKPGFEAVFMFQVVEHMDRPGELFARLGELLAPGGHLFVAVPNAKRVAFNESHNSLRDMPPNHIGRWSEGAFRLAGAAHGLKLLAAEIEPHSLSGYVREDIGYSYLRQAQRPGTLANWARGQRNGKLGKAVALAAAALNAPRRVPVWMKAAKTGGLGGSLWAHFVKD